MIYLLAAIGLTPGGSSTVLIYTQTIHKTTQSTQTVHRTTQLTNWEECGPCPIFASYILAFALHLRKKHPMYSVVPKQIILFCFALLPPTRSSYSSPPRCFPFKIIYIHIYICVFFIAVSECSAYYYAN
jgi:hypothetical protein